MSNQSPQASEVRNSDRAGDQPPAVSFVRGRPTTYEVAAVVAVLAARASATAALAGERPPPARTSRSAWSDRRRLVRDELSPGPGAWHRSFLPR